MKILFADDQIPDEDIPTENLKAELQQRNPNWSAGFINAFVAMRKAVNCLRNAGYEVVVACSYQQAITLAQSTHFDIAIVDLGWFADKTLAKDKQAYAGWEICAAIESADQQAKRPRTPQIVHSSRFAEDATLSIQAADRGMLPIYKNYTHANHEALRAAVKFIEGRLKIASLAASTVGPNVSTPTESIDRWSLYNTMLKCFNMNELGEICFALHIDDDGLKGDEKYSKTRELISFCERRGKLAELLAHCQQMRPAEFG